MHQEERILLSCLLPFLLFECSFCVNLTSITLDQPLKDGDVLVSVRDGDFALGFFSPGNTTNRYVGIWYNKVPIQTIVWVANRQTPVTNNTGVLSIDRATGNLVLTSGNGTNQTPIWSTSVQGVAAGATTSSAKLLDVGNLVLVQRSRSSSDENVIWQSFDHPTNTLVPYMRLGFDLRSGKNWSLTSWKSANDPAVGQYSYGFELSGKPEMFLANGATRVWRSGPWDGTKWNGVPEMIQDTLVNTSYIQNSTEVSIVYGLLDPTLYSRQVLNETSGIAERLTWHPSENRWVKLWSVPLDRCDTYAHCGDYSQCMQNSNAVGLECSCLPGFQPKSNSSWYIRETFAGCERNFGVNVCNNGEGFVPVDNAKVPDTSNVTVDMNLDLKSCARMCAKNCNCTAYTQANVREGGCMTWYGPLIDIMKFTNGGQTVYVRVDKATLAQYSKKSNRTKKIVIIVVVCLGVLLGISLACWLLVKRRQAKAEERRLLMNQVPTSEPSDSGTWGQGIDEGKDHPDLPLFDIRTIFAATDNFALANKLGEGGFGSVYKGRLEDGKEIAVKRLGKNSGQGMDEFKNEVTLIAKLQHRSLVRLLGCSIKQDEKMLIYEYLPNKGLDSFIFNKEKGSLLNWKKRFEIIMGIVRGMVYLHRDSRLRIIHRDLKASNVLLDADMNPKISDFGMAKMFGGDELEANTKRVVGTYGYMAPEYAMEGLFSIKSDVFSFGVLLLEIISGKKNSSYYQDNCVNLIGYVWDLWRFGKALEIVDSSLANSYQPHEVLRCIQVGLLCVQEHASDRPTMSEVSSMLSNETTLPSPGQPAFIFKGMSSGTNSSSTGLGKSVNDVTLTVVEAR